MQERARLIPVHAPRDPDGVVLVLHGGGSRAADVAVSPTQASVLRMIPIAHRIAWAGRGRLAVFRLLNSTRGWDTRHTPAQDARWALDRIAERYGRRPPACLVGHSLGGRAALLAADAPEVVGVAALAPWVRPADAADAPGRTVLFVHGDQDRVADPALSAALARRMAGSARVGYVLVEGGSHAMLRRAGRFSGPAADLAVATLLGRTVDGPVGRVLAGEQWVQV